MCVGQKAKEAELSTAVVVCLQEHEHLRITVERVADYKPDVLLVEKSVARYAQELLLQKGISLVLNVKRALLNRLARCTEAQVRPAPPCSPAIHLRHASRNIRGLATTVTLLTLRAFDWWYSSMD